MHELSIAHGLVETVVDALADKPDLRVTVVNLQLGVLAGVEEESLRFCFDIATADTRLAGSRLAIEHVAARAYCATCSTDVTPTPPQWYRCPVCGTVCAQLSAGREMQVTSVEVVDPSDQPSGEEAVDEAPSA